MNALQYALAMIKREIPMEILVETYTNGEHPSIVNLTSLDDKILNKTIRPNVLLDANIVGGVELVIPLSSVTPAYAENYYTVYHIDPELTMNRDIISVLGLTVLPASHGYDNAINSMAGYGNSYVSTHGTLTGSTALENLAARIGDSVSIDATMHNAHTELVAHNTVAVYAHFRTLGLLGLKVNLANDNNMSNIQPRSFMAFAKMCVLAVKAHIYNQMLVPTNAGYLSGGQDLGVFKNTIDGYSQSFEEYLTYVREVWTKVAFMNDTHRHNRFLISMFDPSV